MIRLAVLLALSAHGAAKVLVTVVDQASGEAITGLTASDFGAMDNRVVKRVVSSDVADGLLDLVLLVDASLAGDVNKPVAAAIIGQMNGSERMALAALGDKSNRSFDFTTSKEDLRRNLEMAAADGDPRLLDGICAALEVPFPNHSARKALVVLTTGIEGLNRNTVTDVIRLARKHGVSIYPVFVHGSSRGMFETIAKQTGGAAFSLRDHKAGTGTRVLQAVRGAYWLRLAGSTPSGDRLRIHVKRREKTFVSALPFDSN